MRKEILTAAGLLTGAALAYVAYRNVRGQTAGRTKDRRAPRVAQPVTVSELDINHCSLQEIMALPGIDSALATRILDNRPYRTKFDLLERFIIPEDVFRQISHDVRVEYAPAV